MAHAGCVLGATPRTHPAWAMQSLAYQLDDVEVEVARLELLLGAKHAEGAALGQFGVTAAYRYAEPRSIAVYDYTNVVFTALFGFVFFSQVPDALSVVGFAVILVAAFGMRR